MRSRTLREGSVGLLILLGVGLFGFLVIWLRGLNLGGRSYLVQSSLENTAGLQVGTAVSYRGVAIGRIAAIEPQTNMVNITIEITEPGFIIPKDSIVETSQSGLIGETVITILPQAKVPSSAANLTPFGERCESSLIVCDGDILPGREGINYDTLIRSADQIAQVLSDEQLVEDIKAIASNTNEITENFIGLSAELTALTQEVRQEISPLSTEAQRTLLAATNAAVSAGGAAQDIQLTSAEARSLLAVNRSNITTTLDNLSVSSARLRTIMDTVTPMIQDGEFLRNLEILSANAAIASTNIREITDAFNTPENLLMLQQTLESARDVFQSAQKIMADIDELTGDPTFRNNIRNLVNGLSGLVSSAEELQQQAQVAQVLFPVTQASVVANGQPAAGQPAAGQPAEAQPAEARPVDGQPVEAQPAQPRETARPAPLIVDANLVDADLPAPIVVPIISHNGQGYVFRSIILPQAKVTAGE